MSISKRYVTILVELGMSGIIIPDVAYMLSQIPDAVVSTRNLRLHCIQNTYGINAGERLQIILT